MTDHKIVVENVSKRFRLQADRPTSVKELFTRRGRDKTKDEFWALQNVSFEIPEASMFALVGHNGSGKSTMLRCIAGIYQPDGGRVRVDGRISTLLELGAGFHPDLSGRENIYMNATMLGMTKKSIAKVFDDIVSFAGVEQFIDSPVKVYSTGMYVRLGFSVAVHVQPEILIIDEVIAVGDEQFQRRCFDHLYQLRREGATIVVVTHGLGVVETMCDGAAWLDHGELQKLGKGAEVAASYLRRVNDKEAADRDEARAKMIESVEADDEADDKPSGDQVAITGVTFSDKDGEEITNAVHGEPFILRIHYETYGVIDSPVFGFAIHAMNGVHVTGTNTQISGFPTGATKGSGVASFEVSTMPLVPGEFEVSVAIADRHAQHLYDRRDRAYRLIVRHGAALPPHGLMDLQGEWSLQEGET